MIEKIIENWLDNSTERAFQGPFCSMLASQGHTVLHMSRHCAMELGKDVITLAPDGVPCAYQLKTAPGGKISLNQWRDINSQVFDLVTGSIVHPSVSSGQPHRSFFVTNGELEEEVSRAIDDMNRKWRASGNPHYKVETIVRGELLQMGRQMDTNLWPSELKSVQQLLEMFLMSGEDIFPRGKFSMLLEDTLPFEKASDGKSPSDNACGRAVSSAALICALAVSKFSASKNHVAEIEGWTIYAAYVMALATRHDLSPKIWKPSFEIALSYIYNRLIDLTEEMASRETLLEGHTFGDQVFVPVRRTWLAGLIACAGLWDRRQKTLPLNLSTFIRQFCSSDALKLDIWGEGAIPPMLGLYWFRRFAESTRKPDDFLCGLIRFVTDSNKKGGLQPPLPSPYIEVSEVLTSRLAIQIGMEGKVLTDDYSGNSWSLESLIHVYVRRNWKRHFKLLWPDITRVAFESYMPAEPWRFFTWRDRERSASVTMIQPNHRQDWAELVEIAKHEGGRDVPARAKSYPEFVLLFLTIFPYRLTADVARWLDGEFVSQ